MTDDRVPTFGFVPCTRCGGELHPIRPGSRAPEYFCPRDGRTREVREGQEIVAMMRKSDLAAAGGGREVDLRFRTGSPAARSPASGHASGLSATAGRIGTVVNTLFWLGLIAVALYGVRGCFVAP